MHDRIRRTELGRMAFDIAKYVFTIVVIGGIISRGIDPRMVGMGAVIGLGVCALAFFVTPSDDKKGGEK